MLQQFQNEFIELCLQYNVLKFGQFQLKSGRPSPYFFNAGELNDGQAFLHLGLAYAKTIQQTFGGQYDILFGPAYKGIPLATAASIALAHENQTIPVSFNRKEAKDHGEGGITIGASLANKRVIVIDDVMTAGTALRQSAEIIAQSGGKLVGAVIALNRQEKIAGSNLSAIQSMEAEYGIRIASIIDAHSLVEYLKEKTGNDIQIKAIEAHLAEYGAML